MCVLNCTKLLSFRDEHEGAASLRIGEAFGVRAYSAAFRWLSGVVGDNKIGRERKAAEYARTPKLRAYGEILMALDWKESPRFVPALPIACRNNV